MKEEPKQKYPKGRLGRFQIGRVYALKDIDGPFYWDGQNLKSFDGIHSFEDARCDGDYFDIPVFVHLAPTKPKVSSPEAESQEELLNRIWWEAGAHPLNEFKEYMKEKFHILKNKS